MALPDIWDSKTVQQLQKRVSCVDATTKPLWGKMNAAQMMAHCCIPYEQALGIDTNRAPVVMRLMVRLFFKKTLTNELPYKKNMPTSPAFIMPSDTVFIENKGRLLSLIGKLGAEGRDAFEGKEQVTLGHLTSDEWNNLLYKHIDHHLRQFGV